MSKLSKSSPTSDSSPSLLSDSSPQPHSSPVSHPSLVPDSSLRPYRHCASPRVRVALHFDGPGKTLQAFKEECDINRIMKRYQQTGVIDHVNRVEPKFGDVDAVDFQTALHVVMDAEARFFALPSEVRDRFGNDPARLLAFVSDRANLEEAVKLGLVDRPPVNVGGPTPSPDRGVAPPQGSNLSPSAAPSTPSSS